MTAQLRNDCGGDTIYVHFRCAVAGAVGWPADWVELTDASPDAADAAPSMKRHILTGLGYVVIGATLAVSVLAVSVLIALIASGLYWSW